jgi:hypothetical protein
MNRHYLFTACIAVLSLLGASPAVADVSLVADLVTGAESSSIQPVGRLSSDLLMVSKNDAGETELLIARSPSGALAKVATLANTPATTPAVSGGTFFSIPSGFAGAGTHWFTDGTAEGTIPVPFNASAIFQRNGAEVFYTNGNTYTIGRFDLSSGANDPSYIYGGSVPVSAILDGVPFGVTSAGVVYYYDRLARRWEVLFSAAHREPGVYVPVYSGENHDELYFAATTKETDTIFVHGAYKVFSNLSVSRMGILEIAGSAKQVYVKVRDGNWIFTMAQTSFQDDAAGSDLPIEPYVASPDLFDAGHFTFGYNGEPHTMRGSLGFVAKDGQLYSFTSRGGLETRHEVLTWQGEAVSVRALRIVGDTLLIFGSTPSLGSEVWSVPTDFCPSDSAKLYPASCGCGVAETDSDGDGTPNCLDACPSDRTKIAAGACGCGNAELDHDGDGTMSCVDYCDRDPGKVYRGACGCGVADTDSDGDGTPNCKDMCQNDAKKTSAGVCGCGIADVDSDRDGAMDCQERCPTSGVKKEPGVCGCNVADTDTDGDGTPDCIDLCVSDSGKIGAGLCGCGVVDTDLDGDGAADCVDRCPSDGAKVEPGLAGCGVSDADSDGDSVPDALDGCPVDLSKTAPGVCGCNASEQDSDNDGTPDCQDECSSDASKVRAGSCGCGVADSDIDGDSVSDCLDLCPEEPTLSTPNVRGCEPLTQVVDLCPLDPVKLVPGSCGCGVSDADANGNGTPDCKERVTQRVEAPVVSARLSGRASRLVIRMVNVGQATYFVEATRLDKRGSKRILRTFTTSSGSMEGIPSKSRWSVRYRFSSQGRMSRWSAPTQVRVK